ncbi:Short-chain dehydrogenase/reductase SDR [Penicillium expansum]|nr:Short-chain dehydrogenase/reductase SDR [Penicillium expansum]
MTDHTGSSFTSRSHHDTYPAIDPTKQDLSSKYIFITGASKGIGRETALSYVRAGCAGIAVGARTNLTELATSISEAASASGKPAPQIVVVPLDVTEEKSVAAAAATVNEAFPRLDILINNAGYLEQRAKIADSDPEEWWRTWNVNVRGPYLVTRAFLPQMLTKGGEKIVVNLSSIAAHLISPADQRIRRVSLRSSDGLSFCILIMGRMRLPVETQAVLTETPRLCADTLVFLTERRREWLAARYISVTWDMEEFLGREEEIVQGDKLKVRMVV